jgi:hypothetical protein
MSSGKAATSLTINAFPDSLIKPYMVPIVGSASFDFVPLSLSTNEGLLFLPTFSQNATDSFILLIDIREPYAVNEILNQFREELGAIWRDNKDISILIIGIFSYTIWCVRLRQIYQKKEEK